MWFGKAHSHVYSNIILVTATTMYIKTYMYITNSAPPLITGLVRPCTLLLRLVEEVLSVSAIELG